MSDDLSTWIPSLVAMGLAAAGALGASFVLRRSEDGTPDIDTARADLVEDEDEEIAHHIAQLRDLEEQRFRLSAETYQQQKDHLEQLAAVALRQRDTRLGAVEKDRPKEPLPAASPKKTRPTPEATGSLAISPQLRGFLWGGGTVAVFAVMYALLSQNATVRVEGGSMTGNTPSQGAAQGTPPRPGFRPDAEMRALAKRLNDNPHDIEALVRLGHKLLRVQAIREAHTLTQQALALDPDHLEARVHAAVITSASGNIDDAVAALDRIVQKQPTMAEAWFFRGMLGMQSNRPELTKESWKRYVEVAEDSPRRERIRGFLNGEGLKMPGGG